MSARITCLLLGSAFALAFLGPTGEGIAQIATDGSAGPKLDLPRPDYDIGADLGRRAGRNLFHSFERFSLDAGERATFSGPDDIRNVISRVTGGARSDIDGTLRSTIPGADFYFLNPAGVMFGPNASLDLQGSFHVSTATNCASPTVSSSAPPTSPPAPSPSPAPRRSGFWAPTTPPRSWSIRPCSRSPRGEPSPSSAATSISPGA